MTKPSFYDDELVNPSPRKRMSMPSKLFNAKIGGELKEWLESQENRSDTIKRALIEYRKGNALSDEVAGQLSQLLDTLRGVDTKLDKILEKDEPAK